LKTLDPALNKLLNAFRKKVLQLSSKLLMYHLHQLMVIGKMMVSESIFQSLQTNYSPEFKATTVWWIF